MNQLSGTIPSSMGNLAQLLYLFVHSCFQFRQRTHIKLTLSTQTSLFLRVIIFRYLNENQLTGSIPSSIGNLAQLYSLYAHSCFQFHQQSHIKLTLSTQTSLFFCVVMFRDLSTNQLKGTIPSSIGNPPDLHDLYAHSCFQFRQQTHIKLTLLTICMFRNLYKNSFSGVIPQALCQNSDHNRILIFPNNGVFTCPLPTCCVSPSSCSLQGYSASCSNDTKATS